MSDVYIGIDVGTGSARAGVFDASGKMLGTAVYTIAMNKPKPDFVEQSSDNIWNSVCMAVKDAMKQSGVKPEAVRGIGFDATCSLVVLDGEGKPLTVSPDGKDDWNIIVWMDHRAMEQTALINSGDHDVLRYVGGAISPEMETPKLLWLKQNLPDTWKRAGHFFDLPDFLVWKATAANVRSLCTTVCKWTYLGHEKPAGRWDENFFRTIGLEDLVDEKFARIGTDIQPMGAPVGDGLSASAATELGLVPGIPVGVSIIDAHAGGLGVIGAELHDGPLTKENAAKRIALIGGTSTCHMAISSDPCFVDGIWGPYYSAMVPGYWLNEGGQSVTGALIDHIIQGHGATAELMNRASAEDRTVYEVLNEELERLAKEEGVPMGELTRNLHVLPYFHGNRSPRADSTLRGVVTGLKLSSTIADLARLYLAAIQAIAYGTRHIIEELNENGFAVETICACGGGTKNPVYLQQHADITNCQLVLSQETEAVLLGSAILGAVASGNFSSIESAMAAMSKAGRIIDPAEDERDYHDRKYRVFHRMYIDHLAYRQMMAI